MDDYTLRRMREIMGYVPPSTDLDREVEPKMIDGDGPQGSPDGIGRGPLLERQKARLDDLHGFWLAGYMH